MLIVTQDLKDGKIIFDVKSVVVSEIEPEKFQCLITTLGQQSIVIDISVDTRKEHNQALDLLKKSVDFEINVRDYSERFYLFISDASDNEQHQVTGRIKHPYS